MKRQTLMNEMLRGVFFCLHLNFVTVTGTVNH